MGRSYGSSSSSFRERATSYVLTHYSLDMPERRNTCMIGRLLERYLLLGLISLQFVKPISHARQPRLSKSREMHQEATRLSFEA
jgi:hypothetical protein